MAVGLGRLFSKPDCMCNLPKLREYLVKLYLLSKSSLKKKCSIFNLRFLLHPELQQSDTDSNNNGRDSDGDRNGGRDCDDSFNYDSTDAKQWKGNDS